MAVSSSLFLLTACSAGTSTVKGNNESSRTVAISQNNGIKDNTGNTSKAGSTGKTADTGRTTDTGKIGGTSSAGGNSATKGKEVSSKPGVTVNTSQKGTAIIGNASNAGTVVPKLSENQKKQVSDKVGAVVDNLNDILKSLQEPKDLDLSGL